MMLETRLRFIMMIFGVDNTMEFRLENQSEWKQITIEK